MKTIWFHVCLVVCVGANSLAQLKTKAFLKYYITYFDDDDFNKFYTCLTSNMTESCRLYLKSESAENSYKITSVEQKSLINGLQINIPVFKCLFPGITYFFGSVYIACNRKTETPALGKYNLSSETFVLVFNHNDEFFFKDSLQNISVQLNTFAYSFSQNMIYTSTTSFVDTNNSLFNDTVSAPIEKVLMTTVAYPDDTTVNTTSARDIFLSTANTFVMDNDGNSAAFVSIITISVVVGVFILVIIIVILLRFLKRKKILLKENCTVANRSTDHDAEKQNVSLENSEIDPDYALVDANGTLCAENLGQMYEMTTVSTQKNTYSLSNAESCSMDISTSRFGVNYAPQVMCNHSSKLTEPSFHSADVYSKLHENRIVLTNEYGDLLPDDNSTQIISEKYLSTGCSEITDSSQETCNHNSQVAEAGLNVAEDCEHVYSKTHETRTVLINEYDD